MYSGRNADNIWNEYILLIREYIFILYIDATW